MSFKNLKKIIFFTLIIGLQSCVMHPSPFKIKILNQSKSRVYTYYLEGNCESCIMQEALKDFCTSKNSDVQMFDLLNPRDSSVVNSKSTYLEIAAINADSLEMYCKNGLTDDILKKQWVTRLSSSIDLKTKNYFILIK